MKTITLKEIEDRVSHHTEKYGDEIEKGIYVIKSKELKKGRVRPKDPAETEILNKFKR